MTPPDPHEAVPAEQRLSQARKLYALSRWEEALALLEPLVLERPGYADLHNMVGVSQHHLGLWSRAERAFREALRLHPRYTEAALNLAVLLNDTGKYDEARTVYRQALEVLSAEKGAVDPMISGKIANKHGELAEMYRQAHLPEEAQAEYERALALCPTFADLRHALAGLLIEQKQHEAACGQLQRCIADQPKYLAPRVRLGTTLLTLNRAQEALAVFQAAVAMAPDNAEAQRGLRLSQSKLGGAAAP